MIFDLFLIESALGALIIESERVAHVIKGKGEQ